MPLIHLNTSAIYCYTLRESPGLTIDYTYAEGKSQPLWRNRIVLPAASVRLGAYNVVEIGCKKRDYFPTAPAGEIKRLFQNTTLYRPKVRPNHHEIVGRRPENLFKLMVTQIAA